MSVFNPDYRQVINPNNLQFNLFPFPAVTAIDIQYSNRNGIGSGIVISPYHVLSAAHNATKNGVAALGLRATTSANQINLSSRLIAPPGTPNNPPPNVIERDYLANYNTTRRIEDDIVLFETSNPLLSESQVIGLMAFVNPRDAIDLSIRTAGYPGDNVSRNIPGNSGQVGRDLVVSPGITQEPGNIVGIRNTRQFFYSRNVSTYRGQSGSGVWHSLDGDSPRVLGVHTQGFRSGGGQQAIQRNSGVLITTDLYNEAMALVEADLGIGNADILPENAIIGSNPSLFFFGGNDEIFGTYRRERIIGNGGDDLLFGGGADDRLEGGDGIDQALFTDTFINYDWTITDSSNPAFEFNHMRGGQSDGKDTTKDIEFGTFEFVDANKDGEDDDGNLFYVPLQVDPNNPTKLKDGPLINPKEKVLDDEGEEIGTITVESPAWMFDGDVEYKLNIGLDVTEQYNIAFIIDRSGSMATGGRLIQTQNALTRLIDSFEESGIDSNIDYSVISFNTTPSRTDTSDSNTAKNAINRLVAGGGTKFSGGLFQATDFFLFQFVNATNLAYFISDGVPSDNPAYVPFAATLKGLTDEVRAFGVAGATLSTLNVIDSDGGAEYLSSAGDLFDAFDTSVDRDLIDRIEVRQEGRTNPIQIISPDELTENGFNLTYEGTIDGLEVSREAENDITFEVVFKEETGIDRVLLNYKITTGQEEVRQQTNNGRNEVINFSVNQSDFTDSNDESFSLESEREIVGNSLDNTFEIQYGNNTISGNEGDDRFILFGGSNFIDGGDGIDTVEIGLNKSEAEEVSKSGNIVNIGTDTTALNVEYIKFNDVLLAVDTLLATPIISFVDRAITIQEGDTGSSFATFTVNLSSQATEDVVIDVTSRSDYATSGIDFILPSGQLTIEKGETKGDFTLEIVGDSDVEGDEEVFLDFTIANGATFANGAVSETTGVNIVDDDSEIFVSIAGDDPSVYEGNSDRPGTLYLNLNRFGGLIDSDTVEVELIPTGDNTAEASDFVNGLAPIEVTFAPGEDNKTLELKIAPDSQVEADETFGVRITNVIGSALVPDEDLVFTILNDDFGNPIVGSTGKDVLQGTQGVDLIDGLEGNDVINGDNDNDIINGDAGKDKLFGDLGDDLIDGGSGKDKLYGGFGNDELIGGLGNDKLFGNSGNDTLIGATIGGELPGTGEKDVLEGGSGTDLFVLGDRNSSFYLGNNKKDHAEIKDWSSEEKDLIQLSSQGNYSLGSSGSKRGWDKKISIFDDGDLIAVVKTKGKEYFDLNNSEQFSFV